MKSNKVYISFRAWLNNVYQLADKIKNNFPKNTKIYGVPRGGCLITAVLSQVTMNPIITKYEKGCIVVDDLIDSGRTKDKYPESTFLVLIDKQNEEQFKGKWVEFWYENTESDDKDLVLRLAQRLNVDVK